MSSAQHFVLTRAWLEAAVFFVIALLGILVLKRFLSRMKVKPQLGFIAELIPYILNFAYVVALSIFIHSAPLPQKIHVWTNDVVYVLTVWVLLVLVRRILLVAATWSTRRVGHSAALQQGFVPLIKNIATLFVFTAGSIMVLRHFGYDVWSLLTALGVGSLAVGLAAKEAISNMISGFVLIMDRNLRPGDRVSLGTFTGDVEEIGLRSTRVRTGDGNTLIVPNFDLVNNRIVNLSMPSRASICSTQIRVPYTADFEKVKQISLKILAEIPKVDQDKGRWVVLTSLSEGFQLIGIGCWLREMDDSGEVLTQFNQRVLEALRIEKIELIDYRNLFAVTGSAR